MSDTERLIEEAGRLCEHATPGPWTASSTGIKAHDGAHTVVYALDGYEVESSDAAFIARARTLVPDLVTALRARDEYAAANLAANKRIVELEHERDEARSKLSRLTTPRPIAEAPRDGSPVLCEVPGYGRRHLFWNEAWYLVGAPEYTYAPVSFYPSLPAEGGQR